MTPGTSAMDWSAQSGSAPDVYQSFLVPAMFVPFGALMLDAADVQAGARVVDIACGTGAVTREAARRAGPGGTVTGVDFGDAMLGVARRQPTADGSAPIAYLHGSAGALPLDADVFDVATCHHGLQFFPDRAGAVAEMHRVLRPGGRVAIATWTAIDDQVHFAALGRALDAHLGADAAAMIAAPFMLDTPEELGALVSGAGFSDVVAEVRSLPVRFADHSGFGREAILAGPIAPLFLAADEATQDAIGAQVAEELADLRTPDGGLASSMSTVLATAVA